MATKKQMLEIDKKSPMTAALSDEHQRRWDDKHWETKINDPERNYDKSRLGLNFEVHKDRAITPIDLTKRINEKVDERINDWKKERLATTGKEPIIRSCQHKSVNIIMGGNRQRMRELAFGNQELKERGHNSDIKSMPEIEQWAVDAYDWACRQFGKNNVVSFIVHCDETNPHAHCVVVPILSDGRLCAKEMFGGKDKVEASKRLRFLHSSYAEVNAKWGLERGDDIHETGATHKSLDEHNRELFRQNRSLEQELQQKQKKVKSFQTMIANLRKEQDEVEQKIAQLEKDMTQTGANKAEIEKSIAELQNQFWEIRGKITERNWQLKDSQRELEKLKAQIENAKSDAVEMNRCNQEMMNYITRNVSVLLKAAILDEVLYYSTKVCGEVYGAMPIIEDTFIDDSYHLRFKDVLETGTRVFLHGLDGATNMAPSSGGGGSSNDMSWRDKDEDLLHWSRRAMHYAHALHYPGNRYRRSQSR